MRLHFATFLIQAALVAVTTAQTPSGTSIHGHVYINENGAAAVRARVSLDAPFWWTGRRVGPIETDENGGFRFDGLGDGPYTLSVKQPGFLTEYVMDVEPRRNIVVRL